MKRAFTLIELLIVVAIIAILAAIAVPNFLDAQARAKVSRLKSDMRSMTTGIETYATDYNAYPLCNNFSLPGARVDPDEQTDAGVNAARRVLERLSTPIAYMTAGLIRDVFDPQLRRSSFSSANPQGANQTPVQTDLNRDMVKYIKYVGLSPRASGTAGFADVEEGDGPAKAFILIASGPERAYPNMSGILNFGSMGENNAPSETNRALVNGQFYDPTNGTISYGYVFRTGGTSIVGGGYASEFMRQAPGSTLR